jgi:hypothetical protein
VLVLVDDSSGLRVDLRAWPGGTPPGGPWPRPVDHPRLAGGPESCGEPSPPGWSSFGLASPVAGGVVVSVVFPPGLAPVVDVVVWPGFAGDVDVVVVEAPASLPVVDVVGAGFAPVVLSIAGESAPAVVVGGLDLSRPPPVAGAAAGRGSGSGLLRAYGPRGGGTGSSGANRLPTPGSVTRGTHGARAKLAPSRRT